jgi:deazaflavin-dependent oxidoreductase (nitroreductase family)
MPSDLVLNTMNAVHRVLLRASGGRIGWTVQGMPVLELTTIGRRTGKPHTVMLTSPYQEGQAYVVVGSRGGDDHHPAWFLNLREMQEVEVTLNGRSQRMRVSVASPEERARLWPLVTAHHKNYAGYQAKTTREIPLVRLEPCAG